MQLQTQVKSSHVNQLGEAEKRFRTISRQCAVVRQVHEKLEQNGRSDARKAVGSTQVQPEYHSLFLSFSFSFDSTVLQNISV